MLLSCVEGEVCDGIQVFATRKSDPNSAKDFPHLHFHHSFVRHLRRLRIADNHFVGVQIDEHDCVSPRHVLGFLRKEPWRPTRIGTLVSIMSSNVMGTKACTLLHEWKEQRQQSFLHRSEESDVTGANVLVQRALNMRRMLSTLRHVKTGR